eukprot:222850-Chlamydomonas_euryale.AAC.10
METTTIAACRSCRSSCFAICICPCSAFYTCPCPSSSAFCTRPCPAFYTCSSSAFFTCPCSASTHIFALPSAHVPPQPPHTALLCLLHAPMPTPPCSYLPALRSASTPQVVATPFNTTFDHLRIADEAQFKVRPGGGGFHGGERCGGENGFHGGECCESKMVSMAGSAVESKMGFMAGSAVEAKMVSMAGSAVEAKMGFMAGSAVEAKMGWRVPAETVELGWVEGVWRTQ